MSRRGVNVVPCNGCTACCRKDAVPLDPGEELRYRSELAGPRWILAHKPNGDCVYLGDGGCTIHETKPNACRWYDCRKVVATYGTDAMQRQAVANGALKVAIYEAAKALRERRAA